MRFSAPLVAAVLLGGAITLVWLARDEPVSVAPGGASPSAADAAPPAVDNDGRQAIDAAVPSFPPARQERGADAASRVASEVARSPLPGEALTTPLVQLFEDQRGLRQPEAGIWQEFPRVLPQIAENERAFAAEPIDASWAAGAEVDVLRKVARINGLELLDLRVECRSTLCRFHMTQHGGQDAAPFQDVLGAIGLEPQWAISLAGRTGSLNAIAYLWREGFAPTRPAQPDEPPDKN